MDGGQYMEAGWGCWQNPGRDDGHLEEAEGEAGGLIFVSGSK